MASAHELNLFLAGIEKKAFKQRFPNIYENIKDLGYELPFENVPISPAFHYCMGGIEVALNGLVKNFKNYMDRGDQFKEQVAIRMNSLN